MPDQDQTNSTTPQDNTVVSPIVPPLGSADTPAENTDSAEQPASNVSEGLMNEVADRISNVHNILIALSSDPSVDELAAAIGISMCLDRIGKRATSIYSGRTPNVLEFLKPENTFETSADVLKDFVIALNKEKADHLRYKLDGDYVKIFITPYRTRIGEEDLEFSYGDFNIEFVLALNVPSGVDLDDALREYGRVMHDASVANITTGNPGKFGDIEWSDKSASSVSEMAARLLYNLGGKEALTGEEATAFLTGIVSATDHFSNSKTSAVTMQLAAELMKSGADRQLISDNITFDSDNMFFSSSSSGFKPEEKKKIDSSLVVDHEEDEFSLAKVEAERAKEQGETPANEAPSTSVAPESPSTEPASEDSGMLADLQAVADGLANSNVATPESSMEPLRIDSAGNETASEPASGLASAAPAEPTAETSSFMTSAPEPVNLMNTTKPETTIAPSSDFLSSDTSEGSNKYGQMLEDALAEPGGVAANPATVAAPIVPTEPEINGVPEINYAPAANEELLPPPPAPPVDLNSTMLPPTMPAQ